ncbi:hypothetical protein COOONC_01877 [Cooperia oncophora]
MDEVSTIQQISEKKLLKLMSRGACMFSDRVAHVGNVTSHSAILELNSTDRNEVSVPPRAATRTRGRIVAHTENSTSESGSLELHSIQADRNEVSVPPHADAFVTSQKPYCFFPLSSAFKRYFACIEVLDKIMFMKSVAVGNTLVMFSFMADRCLPSEKHIGISNVDASKMSTLIQCFCSLYAIRFLTYVGCRAEMFSIPCQVCCCISVLQCCAVSSTVNK